MLATHRHYVWSGTASEGPRRRHWRSSIPCSTTRGVANGEPRSYRTKVQTDLRTEETTR
jgi:hypothetical protein